MSGYWLPDADSTSTLTVEMLLRARDTLDQPHKPHVHIVHPRATGWTLCGACGGPVFVDKP